MNGMYDLRAWENIDERLFPQLRILKLGGIFEVNDHARLVI